MKRLLALLLLAMASGGVIAACGGDGESEAATSNATSAKLTIVGSGN